MALVPEHILQGVIVRGINAMRKDARLVDQLFRNVDAEGQRQMRELFKTGVPFDLCLNYPREVLKLPGIVILLRSQDEGQAWLGDSMGAELPEAFTYEGGIEGEILGGVASASAIGGEAKLAYGPTYVLSGTLSTVTVGRPLSQDWRGRDMTCRIVAGTGTGQIRKITSNTPTVISVQPNWRTPPDSTSVIEVRGGSAEYIGGNPHKMYDRWDTNLWVENRGVYDAMQYQIIIASPNPSMTIYLTMILRAILFLSRNLLEQQGIINLKVSSTDLVPRAEYLPDVSYTRSLNVSFMSPFNIFQEIGDVGRELQVALEAPGLVTGGIDGTGNMSITDTQVGLEPVVPTQA